MQLRILKTHIDLDKGPHLQPRDYGKIDRFSSIALYLASELIIELPKDTNKDRVGIFVGNVYGGWNYAEPQLSRLVERGPNSVQPHLATAWFAAAAQGEVTISKGFRGFSKTFSGQNSAFTEALLSASMAMHFDRIDYAIVMLAESTLSDFVTWGSGMDRNTRIPCDAGFGLLLKRPIEQEDSQIKLKITTTSESASEQNQAEDFSQGNYPEHLEKCFLELETGTCATFELPLSTSRTVIIQRSES